MTILQGIDDHPRSIFITNNNSILLANVNRRGEKSERFDGWFGHFDHLDNGKKGSKEMTRMVPTFRKENQHNSLYETAPFQAYHRTDFPLQAKILKIIKNRIQNRHPQSRILYLVV